MKSGLLLTMAVVCGLCGAAQAIEMSGYYPDYSRTDTYMYGRFPVRDYSADWPTFRGSFAGYRDSYGGAEYPAYDAPCGCGVSGCGSCDDSADCGACRQHGDWAVLGGLLHRPWLCGCHESSCCESDCGTCQACDSGCDQCGHHRPWLGWLWNHSSDCGCDAAPSCGCDLPSSCGCSAPAGSMESSPMMQDAPTENPPAPPTSGSSTRVMPKNVRPVSPVSDMMPAHRPAAWTKSVSMPAWDAN